MSLWLRSAAFNALFYAWTALCVIALSPTLLGPRRFACRSARIWTGGSLALLRWTVGLKMDVRGRERIPPAPAILASKHQSAWDTLIWHYLFDDVAVVLKRELTWIPLFGWYLIRAGNIAVHRGAGGGALRQLLRAARAARDGGRYIAIYPEGTRTAPGKSRDYQPGVAALYRDLAVPITPVALNSGLFWPRRQFIKRPGTVVIEFLEPIPPGLDRRRAIDELARRIEAASRRLLDEAGGGKTCG